MKNPKREQRQRALEEKLAKMSRDQLRRTLHFRATHLWTFLVFVLQLGLILLAGNHLLSMSNGRTFADLELALTSIFLLGIAGTCIWASSIATKALAETMLNEIIANVIERNADKKLENLHTRARTDLDSVRQIVPENNTKPEPAMIRLAQELFKEAGNLKMDSRFHLLPRFRAESSTYVFKLERLQRYALRLGILGTFAGLLLAINAFSTIGAPSTKPELPRAQSKTLLPDEQGTKASALIDALGFSFVTSIAGLIGSLIIAGQTESLRLRQLRCGRRMEDATLSLVTLIGKTVQSEDVLAALEENRQSSNLLRDQVYDQTQRLDLLLKVVDQRLSTQAEAIQQGMNRLQQAQRNLEDFLSGIESSHRRFLKELESLYDTKAISQLMGRVETAVEAAGQNLSGTVQLQTDRYLGELQRTHQRLAKTNEQFLVEVTETFDRASLDNLVKALPASVSSLGELFEIRLGSGLKSLDTGFEGLSRSLGSIESQVAGSAANLEAKSVSLERAVSSINSNITNAAQSSRDALEEVPTALDNLKRKIAIANSGGLVVLDARLFKRVLLGGFAGLIPGLLTSSVNLALSGLILGPALILLLAPGSIRQ